MRKQVDFDIRVFDVTSQPETGGMTHEQVREFVKANYLDKGWETLGVEHTQVSANHVFFAVFLVKYQDDLAQVVIPLGAQVAEKRGPGRPPKVAEVETVSAS